MTSTNTRNATLKVTVDGDTCECTMDSFFRENELSHEDLAAIAQMDVGVSHSGGGGAGSWWIVTRMD